MDSSNRLKRLLLEEYNGKSSLHILTSDLKNYTSYILRASFEQLSSIIVGPRFRYISKAIGSECLVRNSVYIA